MKKERQLILKGQECKKCGYQWFSRVENPKECPECKSMKWSKNNKLK